MVEKIGFNFVAQGNTQCLTPGNEISLFFYWLEEDI